MDMAFTHKPPLSLAAVREGATLRRANSGRQRIGVSQRGVRNGLSCFACRAIRFDVRIDFVQKRDSAYVMLCHGVHNVVSSVGGDGTRAGDGNADRYPSDLSWDTYLGEVTTSEKVEQPPEYVPPPPISAEDICIREKVEALLYTLEGVLIGQLDNDKAQVLCSMLCATVEVQNPVTCFRGSDKCFEWMRALMQVQASIDLHELYYENDMEDSGRRRIYAVWTVRFLGDPLENLSESEPNQVSGETMFEMEESGLVSRISSTWYVLQEDDGASFTKAKDSLYQLLQRTF